MSNIVLNLNMIDDVDQNVRLKAIENIMQHSSILDDSILQNYYNANIRKELDGLPKKPEIKLLDVFLKSILHNTNDNKYKHT